MNIIFLDLDGVCNNHYRLPNGYCSLDIVKIQILNSIVFLTDSQIVLSSAWRYLILNKSMTLEGFKNMLLTYGLNQSVILKDYLSADVNIDDMNDRAKLCKDWLFRHHNFKDYIIIDDLDLGFTKFGLNFHKVNGDVGLTMEDAEIIIKRLNNG